MLQKLREYLANTPREQIVRDWEEVKAKGLKGPTIKEFVASFRQPLAYQQVDAEAFQTEAAQPHLNFGMDGNDYLYAMAA